MKILKIAVLVKVEDGTVHEAIIDQGTLFNFLSGYAAVTGGLKLHEQPLDGVDLVEKQSECKRCEEHIF